uniref:Putative reverse transcriptase domain-containing protein n=1 Tax=Tanacetum cinerariifolium TaxID=118510 RepID=A0A6L2L0W8_TANCI|nr:putative reverse transcriptase domain-containing protein [Tanacetum cinerariifolium]
MVDDISRGLSFVCNNIANFGGDSTSIMEGDESLQHFSPEILIEDLSARNIIFLLPHIILFHGTEGFSIPPDARRVSLTFSEAGVLHVNWTSLGYCVSRRVTGVSVWEGAEDFSRKIVTNLRVTPSWRKIVSLTFSEAGVLHVNWTTWTLPKQKEGAEKESVSKTGAARSYPGPVPLDGLHFGDKLQFVEEPVEIIDREVRRLKQSRIPLVKIRWNPKRGPEFTWEREDQFRKKYPHLFARTASTSTEFVDELAHIISPPEYDCFYFRDLPEQGELMSVLNSGIRENLSTTLLNLPIEDDHSPLLAYVVWIFLAYLTYPVIPPYLHPFGNEDTIFDPGITINHFYSSLQRCTSCSKLEKCHFMVKEGIVPEHKVSEAGLKVYKAKNRSNLQTSTPSNIKDRKGIKNVAPDHLSRIENDETSDDSEVDDNFPGETLMEMNTEDESLRHELTLEPSRQGISNDVLNIRVILFSIHSDDRNPSRVNIKQLCGRTDNVGNKMHNAFPLLVRKFPLPEGTSYCLKKNATARRKMLPLPEVCTAIIVKEKLSVKDDSFL